MKPPINSCGLSIVQRVRKLPSREPGTCMLCRSIYLQVVKVHLFNYSISRVSCVHSSRTTDESDYGYPFVLQKTKTLSIALHLRKCRPQLPVFIVIQSPKDISYAQIFCKDLHETLKYVDEFSELKNDEIQKEHTHTPLSLYLSICGCTLIFLKGYACTSLPLSFSLFKFSKTVWIQIRPEWNSIKNVSSF